MVKPPKATVVVFANKALPDSDYRLTSRADLNKAGYRTIFALPQISEGLAESEYRRLPVTEGFGWRDFFAPLHVLRILVAVRRHAALAHFFSSKLYLVGPLMARLVGVPAVITITGFGRAFDGSQPSRLLGRIYLRMLRHAIRSSAMVLVQNSRDGEVIRDLVPSAGAKVRFVGSALDVTVASSSVRDAPPREPPVALFVGRLLASKGVLDFLELASRGRGEWSFRVVGPSSPGEPKVAERVKDAGASGLVEYLGELTPAETRRVYESSDVLVMPSQGEGLARTLLEAGAAGIPVVAYDINGTHDLLTGSAALVEVGDVAGLASVLARMRADGALRQRLGRELQERVRRDYSVDAFTRRTIAVYEEVLGDRPSRSTPRHGIVQLSQHDLGEILDVQLAAFRKFRLTAMGPRFVRAYLSYFVGERFDGLAIGMRQDGRLVGIALGTASPAAFYAGVRRSPWRLFAPACLAIARRPQRLRYLLRSTGRVRSIGEVPGPDSPSAPSRLAELSSLAIHPDFATRGLGRDLLEAFVAAAFRVAEVEGVELTTDADGNDRVNAFYERAGFVRVGAITGGDGRRLNRYVLRRA